MSVEFDPVPLGRPRRRTDPVVIVGGVILLGLALAILKPWERDPDGPKAVVAASASAGTSVAATAVESASAAPSVPEATTSPPLRLSWADVGRAAVANPSFAIDLVTVDRSASTGSAHPVYSEGTRVPTPGGSTILDTHGESIAGLGVTTERGAVAEDVRIWRVRPNGVLDWVDADPIDGTVAGGPLVLAIPGRSSAFPAGTYRVDALVDGTIRRVEVAIPGPTEHTPPSNDSPYPTETGLVPLTSSDPSAVLAGPFATVDGRGVGLRALPIDGFDEARAWGASVEGLAGGPGYVPRAYLPRATGLGVMLTSHAQILSASIDRLAPDDRLAGARQSGGVSFNHGGTPWVGFEAPDRGAWQPGVYAMTVAWNDADGRHDETWHVELRPGPSTHSAPASG